MLVKARAALDATNEGAHSAAYEAVLRPLRARVHEMRGLDDWETTEQHQFSLSPLGYITRVGEQLLTLPQQLEPFVAGEILLAGSRLRVVDEGV